MYYTVQVWMEGKLFFDESYDNIDEYMDAMNYLAGEFSEQPGFTIIVNVSQN